MANSQVNTVDTSYSSYIGSAAAGKLNSPHQGHVVPETASESQPVGSSQVNISQEARDRLQVEASARDVKTAIGQRLSQMKEALTEIVKQYPPYSVEDRRRVAYLQLFSGLRKEIEALTAPLGRSVEQSAKAAAQVPVLDPVKASDQDVVAAVRSVDQALKAA